MSGNNGNRSGFYRVNGGGTLERVSSKVIAAAALVTALGVLWGAMAAGGRLAQSMQRPAIESVAKDVYAPVAAHTDSELTRLRAEQESLLPKAEYHADMATRDAKEDAQDAHLKQTDENVQHLVERIDRLLDALASQQRDRRGG